MEGVIVLDGEQREKIYDGLRAYWSNPEFRKERSERMKAMWANPELRKKIVDSLKGYYGLDKGIDSGKNAKAFIKKPRGYLVERSGYEDGCVKADRVSGKISSCFSCPFGDCVLDYHHNWYILNRERIREQQNIYYLLNKEKIRERQRVFYENNKDRVFAKYRRYNKMRKLVK